MKNFKLFLTVTLLFLTFATQVDAAKRKMSTSADYVEAVIDDGPAGNSLTENHALVAITEEVKKTTEETLELMKVTAIKGNEQLIRETTTSLLGQIIEALQHLSEYSGQHRNIEFLITHQICQVLIEMITHSRELIADGQENALLSLFTNPIKAKIAELKGKETTQSQIDFKRIADDVGNIISHHIATLIDQTGRIITTSQDDDAFIQSQQIAQLIVTCSSTIVNEIGNIIATVVKEITTSIATKKATESINSQGTLWALSKAVGGVSGILTLGYGRIDVAVTIGSWVGSTIEGKIREIMAQIIAELNKDESKELIIGYIMPHVYNIHEQLQQQPETQVSETEKVAAHKDKRARK